MRADLPVDTSTDPCGSIRLLISGSEIHEEEHGRARGDTTDETLGLFQFAHGARSVAFYLNLQRLAPLERVARRWLLCLRAGR